MRRSCSTIAQSKPSTSRRSPLNCCVSAFLSSTRSTASSPKMLGMIDTRKSMGRPSKAILKRPSCGTRRSAMSSSDITLMREMTCSDTSTLGTVAMLASTPSRRYLTTSPEAVVSR